MKKFLMALLMALALVGCDGSKVASEKYETLDAKMALKTGENSVVEIFSYACIHCYNQHKAGILASVQKDFPDAKFDMWQVGLMGQFGEAFVKILSYANAIDDKNEVLYVDNKSVTHKILGAYFEATFGKRVDFKNEAEFYEFGLGVFKGSGNETSKEEIENYALSDAGASRVNTMGNGLEIAKYVGTPAFVVNGKYLVRNENIESNEDFVKVIKELLNK